MNPETVKQMRKYLKPGNGWRIDAIVCVELAVIYMVPLLMPVCLVICLIPAKNPGIKIGYK